MQNSTIIPHRYDNKIMQCCREQSWEEANLSGIMTHIHTQTLVCYIVLHYTNFYTSYPVHPYWDIIRIYSLYCNLDNRRLCFIMS